MRRIDVFFYGLFIDENLLRAMGVTAIDLRPASVSGFELRIGNRATFVPTQSGRVFGFIASLTHADLGQLYADQSVQAYRPEAVLAHLTNGETLPALCFNLVEMPSTAERNLEYVSKLRTLAERLGFPAEYIASIK